jgi:hypothetical protein
MTVAYEFGFSDGCLFRHPQDDLFSLDIYRGGGRWEAWSDSWDWLDCRVIEASDVDRMMADWDAASGGPGGNRA